MRHDGRKHNELRKFTMDPFYLNTIPYNVLVCSGNTRVLCCATLDKGVPPWLKGQGKGWVTAEYGMLPKSSNERIQRERKSVSGRTQEIQRLIGRSIRAGVDLIKLGEKQILVDCDVIQADGGTRTASINGAFVALSMLFHDMLARGEIKETPLIETICAISAGIVNGEPCLDLDYIEDSTAHVDMNIIMTGNKKLVEVQGTAEGKTFERAELDALIDLGEGCVKDLVAVQNKALAEWIKKRA